MEMEIPDSGRHHSLRGDNIYKSQNEETMLDLFRLKKQIVTLEREIKELEEEKNNIQTIQILQPPSATIKQIKTKRNVLLTSIVGLFLMLFVAFFLEYISKYKNREKRAEG